MQSAMSTSQKGFRHGKGTMCQLHNLMNVLSDANTSKQNLYMLYVKFLVQHLSNQYNKP